MCVMEILVEARRLVAEVGWCQHYGAVDANGRQVQADSDDACGYCLTGAIFKAAGGFQPGYLEALAAMDTGFPPDYDYAVVFLNDWNDLPCRTQKHVVAKFDEAIERQKA